MRSIKNTLLLVSCMFLLSSCTSMHNFQKFNDSNVRPAKDATYAADGLVAIYSLDGDSPAADVSADEKTEAVTPMLGPDGSMAVPGRENVTVYPFEDDLMVAAMAPGPETSTPAAPTALTPVESSGYQSGYATLPTSPDMQPERIYFANGSAAINAEGHEAIDNATGAARGARLVKVEGHASAHTVSPDPVTSRIINLKISMERALNVAKELIRRGVPANMIQTTAWGDAKPALAVDGMSAEDASRRVEIYANGASPSERW